MPVYGEASSLFEIDEPALSPNVLAPLPIKTEQIGVACEKVKHPTLRFYRSP